MFSGWIKSYRRKLEHPLFKKPLTWHFFEYCCLKANHKEKKIIWCGEEFMVERGSFITGRKKASDETGLSEQNIRTALRTLLNLGMIEKSTSKSTSKFSYITVCNYEKYQTENIKSNQQINQQSTSNQPAINQQSTTNKNDKNSKNAKNDKNDKNVNNGDKNSFAHSSEGKKTGEDENNGKRVLDRDSGTLNSFDHSDNGVSGICASNGPNALGSFRNSNDDRLGNSGVHLFSPLRDRGEGGEGEEGGLGEPEKGSRQETPLDIGISRIGGNDVRGNIGDDIDSNRASLYDMANISGPLWNKFDTKSREDGAAGELGGLKKPKRGIGRENEGNFAVCDGVSGLSGSERINPNLVEIGGNGNVLGNSKGFGITSADNPIRINVADNIGGVERIEKEKDREAKEDFFKNVFWPLYPKREGRRIGKKLTLEYIKKHVKVKELEDLAKAVKHFAASRKAKDGFAEDPIRFLKKDTWRDWVEEEDGDGSDKKDSRQNHRRGREGKKAYRRFESGVPDYL